MTAALERALGEAAVIDPGMFIGSEDVSAARLEKDIPTNHSPFFAPAIRPTIEVGVTALSSAVREFLG